MDLETLSARAIRRGPLVAAGFVVAQATLLGMGWVAMDRPPQFAVASMIVVAMTAVLGTLLVRAYRAERERWDHDLEHRILDGTAAAARAHEGILVGLAKLSEYRDNETGMHVERLCAYSGVLARQLMQHGTPIDETWIARLEVAAALHDVGKVSIPDAILLKPGRLTPAEFEIMKTHAEAGEEALLAVRDRVGSERLLDMGIEIAGGHHERWDGSGYPRGLAGEDIPLAARIVALADVFDALMSKLVYKPALPFDDVVETIERERGTHFDPEVVDAFLVVKDELRDIRSRLQDPGSRPALLPHRDVESMAAAPSLRLP